MKINKINNYGINASLKSFDVKKVQNQGNSDRADSQRLTTQLDYFSTLNKINFTGNNYRLGLDSDELKMRTDENHLAQIKLLSPDSPEYLNLEEGDKRALRHLISAADRIAEIELQLDDENNIPFRNYLYTQILNGNPDAEMTMKLFNGHKGVFGKDLLFNEISLAKDLKQSQGRGVYPRDLSVEEFHSILFKMLEEGKSDEVKKILTQRSVVERDGDYLKGIDYVDKFSKEFNAAANALDNAAEYSTNEDFNEYLKLQAKALRTPDPMLDAYADKKWASLQDTPLEFTITRENYEDKMTETIFKNKELLNALNENGITPVAKDFLGGRVGIVHKEGTEFLKNSKKTLPILAELMPYKDEYEQIIDVDNKQSMVDVDLVDVAGSVGEYRGKITLAENLPNPDKLSFSIGGGRRNVYHRSIRGNKFKTLNIAYENILAPEQKKYLFPETSHYFTIGHENAHTLGPHNNDAKLGQYRNILEENKADVAAMSFVDKLTEMGVYTEDERKGLLINFVLGNFMKAKPDNQIAHRVRQVMQCKYLGENNAYEITPDNRIHVNIDNVVPACKKMLEEIIRIQIDGDYQAAEDYVNRNFVWTDDMELISQQLQKHSNNLNGTLQTPLADYLRK